MIYYLNMGFVLEQALVDIVKRYIDRQKFDDVYGNFHISVVNEHPFAHLIVDNHARAQDSFPSIVLTTQSDSKPSDLMNTLPQPYGVGFTSDDLDELISKVQRVKTKIDDITGEVVEVKKGGVTVKEKIPGYVFNFDPTRLAKLKEVADSRTVGEEKGYVYGIKVDTMRRDRVSVEIWAENNQLKNEIYEHLRLLFASSLEPIFQEQYAMFNPSVFDGSINGERSSNYNLDFGGLLCGSHISFEVDYNVSQIILDTEINNMSKEIITEVINHVKE